MWGFCEFLKGSGNPGALQPYLPSILDGLVTLATQASSEVLSLILETCCIVVSVDSNFTAANVGRISTLCLAVFIKANNDPVLVALVQDVVRELCQNPGCTTTLQTKFIPTLASILNASTDKVGVLFLHYVSWEIYLDYEIMAYINNIYSCLFSLFIY